MLVSGESIGDKMSATQLVHVPFTELQKHDSRDDCWIAVHSKVWDLTDFIDEHPGGAESR